MSTKKDHKRSLLLDLENAILALESFGMNEQDIFSLTNMVMRGFVRDGIVTEEYLLLAKQAIEAREKNEEPTIIISTK